jgi:hypothetical protein
MPGHESVTVRERSEVCKQIEDLEDKINHIPPTRQSSVMHKVGRFFMGCIDDLGASMDMYGQQPPPAMNLPIYSPKPSPEG